MLNHNGDEGASFTCKGRHIDIVFGLTVLISQIKKESSLSDEDIRFAVSFGLTNDVEREA